MKDFGRCEVEIRVRWHEQDKSVRPYAYGDLVDMYEQEIVHLRDAYVRKLMELQDRIRAVKGRKDT